MAALAKLNQLDAARAEEELLRCCGSRAWARAMTASRPFGGTDALLSKAGQIWRELSKSDWLEAFGHHPKIGEKQLRDRFAATATWAKAEQKGVNGAPERTLQALLRGNEAYEKRFGHVFLICATGKTADEMLSTLERRLNNDPETELAVAAAEQEKITRIRLGKWLETS